MALNTAKDRRVPFIPGTKPSIKNAQLLASSGTPSLDNIIGGGLPIGSMFIVEDDTYGTYGKVILKYFMAEGVVTEQPVFVASQDITPMQLVAEMPSLISKAPVVQPLQSQNMDKQMKIAWRYQNMRIVDPSPSGEQSFGHYYDLTKPMEREMINNADITEWYDEVWHEKSAMFEHGAYASLLKSIHETVKAGEYSIYKTPAKRKLLRIAIHSLGSRLWFCDNEDKSHADLIKFLYCLKALLRNSYAIAVITMPVDNFEHSVAITERIEHMSDIAIKFESFAGSMMETNPLFKDYHGQLYIKKLAALNTLAPSMPESRDLVFKLRRKKFVIEILHLPPELGDTTQREQDEIPGRSGGCMASSTKSLLDF